MASIADLYAGKICAALDRQHPRDLFDVGYLLDTPFSEGLKIAFLVYLISHNRPMHELLQPNRLDQTQPYNNEFLGMTNIVVSYEELIQNRERLIAVINNILTSNDKEFLLSVKKGQPNWEYLGVPHVYKLPGVVWKQMNIKKMDATKHFEAIKKLEEVLSQHIVAIP